MIHYHGTPVSGTLTDAAKFLAGRHALVSFAHQNQMDIVADVCQSFVLDNGAFTTWKKGKKFDFDGYVRWVELWSKHPGFDWALIPDEIDGDEDTNDELISQWAETSVAFHGVPVWHLHESLSRLQQLAQSFRLVALGSSGQWATPGSNDWWQRMEDVMAAICDEHGRPACKLHGLRMLNPAVFTKLPLSSADSTNACVNAGSIKRFGMYVPVTAGHRATVIADRIESHNSATTWQGKTEYHQLELI